MSSARAEIQNAFLCGLVVGCVVALAFGPSVGIILVVVIAISLTRINKNNKRQDSPSLDALTEIKLKLLFTSCDKTCVGVVSRAAIYKKLVADKGLVHVLEQESGIKLCNVFNKLDENGDEPMTVDELIAIVRQGSK